MAANLRLFQSGDFADLVVKCQDREWKVRRAIVCQHSKYFERMCKSGFRESITGVIELQEEEPAMVEWMLLYLYVLEYNIGPINPLLPDSMPQVIRSEEEIHAELTTHVRMYAMADKYDIPSLSFAAKSKFAAQIGGLWPIPGLPEIANEVFTTVPASDRGFKDIILKICVSHATEIVNQLTSKHPASDSAHNDAGLSKEDADGLNWSSVLTANGELATEILTNVVKGTDEELCGLREVHEDTMGAMQKLQEEKKVERKRYADLVEEFADYRSHVNHMMHYSVKGRPCDCDAGFKFRFTQGTRARQPRLRLVCVSCRKRCG